MRTNQRVSEANRSHNDSHNICVMVNVMVMGTSGERSEQAIRRSTRYDD